MTKKNWGPPTRTSARIAAQAPAAPLPPLAAPSRARAPPKKTTKKETAAKKATGRKRPNRGEAAPNGKDIPSKRSPDKPSGINKVSRPRRTQGSRTVTEQDALAGAAADSAANPAAATSSSPVSREGSQGPNDGEETLPRLAKTVQSFDVQLGGKNEVKETRTIRGELYVHSPDPTATSLLPYSAVFHLTPLDSGTEEDVQVGTIQAHRVDKKTAYAPDAQGMFLQQLLKPSLKSYEKYGHKSVLQEIAASLRAVFTNKGLARATDYFQDELNENSLLLINLVHTEPQFQKRGLLRPILQSFRQMLQQLPEWFTFNDLIILSPGAPGDEKGDVWGEMDAGEITKILTGVYERADDYRWMIEHTVGTDAIAIMGRMFRDEDMPDAPEGDDVAEEDNDAASAAADGGAEDSNSDA